MATLTDILLSVRWRGMLVDSSKESADDKFFNV